MPGLGSWKVEPIRVGRTPDELDGYSKHAHAALYDVLAGSEEQHLGLDPSQGRVEVQLVIPLVNAKTG